MYSLPLTIRSTQIIILGHTLSYVSLSFPLRSMMLNYFFRFLTLSVLELPNPPLTTFHDPVCFQVSFIFLSWVSTFDSLHGHTLSRLDSPHSALNFFGLSRHSHCIFITFYLATLSPPLPPLLYYEHDRCSMLLFRCSVNEALPIRWIAILPPSKSQ